ncbi:MAG: glycosyl hydrolase 53 family protein [Chitinophagales bacterium]
MSSVKHKWTSLKIIFTSIFIFLIINHLQAQEFYFGADLSYVNEMEDCGVVYKENNLAKDPYQIFADHNCNLVRLRMWHTPSWYDNLNIGHRYSDYQDILKSSKRAKTAGMDVLLDFHLSDNWADPSKQLIPSAWLQLVFDLPTLKDSLYNHISSTLIGLAAENVLPDMVQIGNETNKGILLSPIDNAIWTLDWERNSQLFNTAIQAVRDVETTLNRDIKIALHIAGPDNVKWLLEQFTANGVTDFDIIGFSYYWQWHQPTNIVGVGALITELKQLYPTKKSMIFETGYPWTSNGNDNASNILGTTQSGYPASPENQKKWIIDLSKSVAENGGIGVIYWEPAWVSSNCSTQWALGSHYENATFFDFDNNLIANGGIEWMEDGVVGIEPVFFPSDFKAVFQDNHQVLKISVDEHIQTQNLMAHLYRLDGQLLLQKPLEQGQTVSYFSLPQLANGVYLVSIWKENHPVWNEKVSLFR